MHSYVFEDSYMSKLKKKKVCAAEALVIVNYMLCKHSFFIALRPNMENVERGGCHIENGHYRLSEKYKLKSTFFIMFF